MRAKEFEKLIREALFLGDQEPQVVARMGRFGVEMTVKEVKYRNGTIVIEYGP